MDQMVLEVQQWLNNNYNENVTEDGVTGGATVSALIKALQIEIGVPSPDGVFGKETLQMCPIISSSSASRNEAYIVQGALYCKGYDPHGFDGAYGQNVENAIEEFQADAGLTNPNGEASNIVLQALLNTDAYILISGGDSKMRTIQQNLNRDYNSVIGLIPTNGVYSRSTNTALIKALQHEEGNTPDGIWGTNTKNACPTIPGSRSTTNFVLLLQYALYCNGYDPNGFDGAFGSGLQSAISNFQSFVGLSADGSAGPQTWASLLVSYGDPNRSCTACDCSTTITNEIAATLKANGYQVVGRYLTGKYAMTPEELQTIFSNGLKVFPIYEYGNTAIYFTPEQGTADAILANDAALLNLGFLDGTIYFAVDFDALDSDVTNIIIPYFEAINNEFAIRNIRYSIGIYGPRNVCSRVINAGLAVNAFVSDMSSGFSGNLGYRLPTEWAFDQISTVTIGSGAGQIEIDKDVSSGKDTGASSVYTNLKGHIIEFANSTGLANLLGLQFDASGDPIPLIDEPTVQIDLTLSIGDIVGNDSNIIKFTNGQFSDSTAQTAFQNILAGLSPNGARELTILLGKIGTNTDLYIEASYASDSITISIYTETTDAIGMSQQIALTQTLNIKLSWDMSDTGASIVQAAQNVLNSVTAFAEKHPVLMPLIIAGAICIVIVAGDAGVIASLITAIATAVYAAFGEVVAAVSFVASLLYLATE